jgi:hypothetical protein
LASHALAPLAELPMLEVVSGTHIIADLTLPLGKVAHIYLAQSLALFPREWFRFQLLKPICIQHPPSHFRINMWRLLLKCPDQSPVFECAARHPSWRQIIRKVSESYTVRSKCQTYEIVKTFLRETMIASKCAQPQWHDRILFVVP